MGWNTVSHLQLLIVRKIRRTIYLDDAFMHAQEDGNMYQKKRHTKRTITQDIILKTASFVLILIAERVMI